MAAASTDNRKQRANYYRKILLATAENSRGAMPLRCFIVERKKNYAILLLKKYI